MDNTNKVKARAATHGVRGACRYERVILNARGVRNLCAIVRGRQTPCTKSVCAEWEAAQ